MDVKQVVEMYATECSYKAVARKLGVPANAVRGVVAAHFDADELRAMRRAHRSQMMQGNARCEGRPPSARAMLVYKNRVEESNPNWKGEGVALKTSGNAIAIRRFSLAGAVCETCGVKAQLRHHRDENTYNNDAANIAFLCRRCHAAHHAGERTAQLPRGEASASAKLTEAQVREVRALAGSMSARAIGRRFGVSHATINALLAGRTWKESA